MSDQPIRPPADPNESGCASGAGSWRSADVLLADGSTVHIRRITPNDADLVVALHARFSDRTRYLRYFTPYPRIPARDLRRFVNVDHCDREALVAVLGDDLIAIGRYDRLGSGACDAEVAFVVEDAHQGRGIGSILLEHLAAVAAESGITRFVAEVLPQNEVMLGVFSDAGYVISRKYADGVAHLTFPIAPTPRSIEVQRRREQLNEAASIARIMAPRSVAVYGVRAAGTGIGATILRHLDSSGFTGTLHIVHPDQGRPSSGTVPSAVDIPGGIDIAVVAVPATRVTAVVDDAGAAGAHALVVVSATDTADIETTATTETSGAAEPPAGEARQADLVQAARMLGMRVVGPNCLGIINTDPAVSLNASLVPMLPRRGRVGVFCQSAALGIAVLAEAHRRHLGLSSFVSVGNRADVSGNDMLQYWRSDPDTDVVLLYLETFGNPRKFSRIAREMSREKPIVMVTAGAGSGPGMTLLDGAATGGLFARSGVIRVATIGEMFDVGDILAHQPLPAGDQIAVVGNSPALAALASDGCRRAGLSVAAPRLVPAQIDTAADVALLADEVGRALADDDIDTVYVVLVPPLAEADTGQGERVGPHVARHIDAVVTAAAGAEKPVLVTLVGVSLRTSTVPVFATVEEAVRAMRRVAAYSAWRRRPWGAVPNLSNVDYWSATSLVRDRAPVAELLAAYGVSVLTTVEVDSESAAGAAARRLGYPVALKTADSGLRQRVDLGAVRLNLADVEALSAAYQQISVRFGPKMLVQPMAGPGVACVVEMVDDPAFGPVIGFGLGGAASHLLGDRAWRAAPLTDADAAELLRLPRAAALLRGYQGAAPVDLPALADLLLRVSQLADEHPHIKQIRLNPVLAHVDGVSVVHAEVAYGDRIDRPDTGPRRLS